MLMDIPHDQYDAYKLIRNPFERICDYKFCYSPYNWRFFIESYTITKYNLF